jgi:hypothetical protein
MRAQVERATYEHVTVVAHVDYFGDTGGQRGVRAVAPNAGRCGEVLSLKQTHPVCAGSIFLEL